MFVTLLVFHWSILMFLMVVNQNNSDMSVINEVSMKFKSASGPCSFSCCSISCLSSFFVLGCSLSDFVLDVMCIGML